MSFSPVIFWLRRHYALPAFFLAFLFVLLGIKGVLSARAWGDISCSLAPAANRTIVTFHTISPGILRADKALSDAQAGPVAVNLPAGKYEVTLVSFDDHANKQGQVQPNETWYVKFFDEGGMPYVQSAPISDLPDHLNYLTMTVNGNLSLTKPVASVLAVHGVYPNSNPNSITPVCAAFDLVEAYWLPTPSPSPTPTPVASPSPSPTSSPAGQSIIVKTNPAGSITASSATLHGYVDPVGSFDTVRWFEWGTSASALTQKTRVYEHGHLADFIADTVFGLAPNSVYYFRLVGQNSGGTVYGSTHSFITAQPSPTPSPSSSVSPSPSPSSSPSPSPSPSVLPEPLIITTRSAASITDSDAVLRGFVDPSGVAGAELWFEWGRTPSLGNVTPRQNAGASAQDFEWPVSGLFDNTTYYFQAMGKNQAGTRAGSMLSFRTGLKGSGALPIVTTDQAHSVTETSAVINGTVDPNETHDTVRWFEWGTTLSFGSETPQLAHGSLRASFSHTLASLEPNTVYYFRAVAKNSAGRVEGQAASFTTRTRQEISAIFVETRQASGIALNQATLVGFVDARGSANVSRWFEWGSTLSLGNETQRMFHGTGAAEFRETLSSLNPNTTYYVRAVAQNASGITRGSTLSFTTLRSVVVPVAVTKSPTFVTETSAQLNGTVIRGFDGTTRAWFEWGLQPSLLDRNTAVRSTGGADSVEFSDSISGLSSGVVYYYRLVVQDQHARGEGGVLSFRTLLPPAQVPSSVLSPTPASVSTPRPQQSPTAPTLANMSITKEVYNPSFPDCRVTDCRAVSGNTLQYTVHIRNLGSRDLKNVTIRDTIPLHLDFLSASDGGTFNTATREIVWSMPVLGPQEVKGVTTNTRVKQFSQDAVIENAATVEAGGAAKASNRVSVVLNAVSGPASNGHISPVALTIQRQKDNVAPGEKVDYTITYRHQGSIGLSRASLVITLPPELTYQQLIPSRTGSQDSIRAAGNTVTLSIGDMFPGDEGTAILNTVVSQDAEPQKVFTTAATLTYVDSLTNIPGEENAFAVNTVVPQESAGLGLAALFGGGGLASGLLIAVLVLAVLLLLLFIVKTLLGMRRPKQSPPTPIQTPTQQQPRPFP